MSPTARSLSCLRAAGYLAQVVERWNPHAKRRVDLWGFIDIVSLDGNQGVLGVQTTTATNISHRLEKLQLEAADAMARWLLAGNRLVVHGWAKKGPRRKRKLWVLTERVIDLEDVGPTAVALAMARSA